MIYEIEIALRTLRREGVGSLCKKLGAYLHQLASGLLFWFRRLPRNATPEELVDFSFRAAGGLIRPTQVRSEIIRFAAVVQKQKPRTVVEIGTATGGTLFLWCALADPEANIVSIDLPGGIHGGGYPFWKTFVYKRFAQPKQTLSLLRANSQSPESVATLKAILGGRKIDFLFIDGDHTYKGVKADYDNYAPLVGPGGMVVFHDVCLHPPELDCHVDVFWREVREKFRHEEIIENPGQGTCGIGVLFV
jgi:predicted O-methyltransferase YrrM